MRDLVACFLMASLARGPGAGGPAVTTLEIPVGRPVHVDGVLTRGEWDDAVALEIPVAQDWVVRVLVKHDGANLDLAFTHLRHGTEERYPEVLLDPALADGETWRAGQLWLHSSAGPGRSWGRRRGPAPRAGLCILRWPCCGPSPSTAPR
jgi:hypothetical protein